MDHLYIKRVLKGESEAFGFLVRQYQTMAFRTAMSIVKNESDAQDVVQSSFIQAYQSLHTFRQEAKFSTWLSRIVINKSFRFIQKRSRKKEREQAEAFDDSPITYNEGLLNLNQQDLADFLKKGLHQLAPKEALCIQLFYLEEYHIDEIEAITEFSKSHIKVLLHRGRKNLYNQLIDSYERMK